MIKYIYMTGIFVVAILSITLGVFLCLHPAQAIEIQRKFYEKINWKIEPVSLEKELLNTRIMGAGLIIVTIWVMIYVVIFR